MLKKIICLIILLVFFIPSLGVSSKDKEIKIIKGDSNYPPYEFLNENGEPDGFNIDIFKAVAREMGFDYKIQLGVWSKVRKELEDGKIDALVGMYKTEERDKLVDFSISHFIGSYFIFVRKNDYNKNFDIKNKIGIVQKYDLGYDYLKNNFKDQKIIVKETLKEIFTSLSNGEGDFVLSPRIQGEIILNKNKIKNIISLKKPLIQRKYCFAVKEGDESFLAQLNEGLNVIKQSGQYDKIYDKWFGIYQIDGVIDKRFIRLLSTVIVIVLILFFISLFISHLLNQKIKKIKSVLLEKQKDWESVFNNTSEILVMNELARNKDGKIFDFRILECNKAYSEVIGIDTKKMYEGKLASEAYINYPRHHLDIYIKAVQENKTLKFDYYYKPLDKYFYISVVPVAGDKFATLTSDITDFKKTENALYDSEIFYRTLFNNSPNAVFLLKNYKIVDCNEKVVELFGYDRDEIIGFEPAEISPKYQRNNIISKKYSKQKIDKACEEGINEFEWVLKKKNGTIFDAEITLSPIKIKSGNYVQSIVKDITERKKLEFEMKNMRFYLKSLIDSMPSVIIGIDKDLRIKNINVQAEKNYNKKENEVLGKTVQDVYPKIYNRLKAHLNDEGIIKIDEEFINERYRVSDKSKQYEELIIYPLKSTNEGYVLRIDDVTEKVNIEEIMIQTEKMMSVGGLAAGMAHEINNPLSGIIQGLQNTKRRFSKNIQKNLEVADKYQLDLDIVNEYMKERKITMFLDGISNSAKRAAFIVHNMLDFARKSKFEKKLLNINDVILDVLQLASSDYDLKKNYDFKHVNIIKRLDSNISTIKGSKQEIEQVLLNLLKNSAQELAVNHISDPTIKINTYNKDDKVFIEFSDNGDGISDRDKKHIFEPFYTTKDVGVGTGLGLSVSYFIIKQNHNGDIFVDENYKDGAKFIISFPVE